MFILKGKVPNEKGEMVEEGDEEDVQVTRKPQTKQLLLFARATILLH